VRVLEAVEQERHLQARLPVSVPVRCLCLYTRCLYIQMLMQTPAGQPDTAMRRAPYVWAYPFTIAFVFTNNNLL
jgi:hypothetical protein